MKVVGEEALHELIKHTAPCTIVHYNDKVINLPDPENLDTEDDVASYYRAIYGEYDKLSRHIRVYGMDFDFLNNVFIRSDDNFVEITIDTLRNIILYSGAISYSWDVFDDSITWEELLINHLIEYVGDEYRTAIYESEDRRSITIKSERRVDGRNISDTRYYPVSLSYSIIDGEYVMNNMSPDTNPIYYYTKIVYDLLGRISWGDRQNQTPIRLYNYVADTPAVHECISRSYDKNTKIVKLTFFDDAHKYVVSITENYTASIKVTNI